MIERHEIHLSETHSKMIISGWGKEAYENSVVERITYLSDLPADKAGGLKIKGYIAYPKDNSKQYPCIIWCRGGAGNKGAIDTFTARGIYGQLASWAIVFLLPSTGEMPAVKVMMKLVVKMLMTF